MKYCIQILVLVAPNVSLVLYKQPILLKWLVFHNVVSVFIWFVMDISLTAIDSYND